MSNNGGKGNVRIYINIFDKFSETDDQRFRYRRVTVKDQSKNRSKNQCRQRSVQIIELLYDCVKGTMI